MKSLRPTLFLLLLFATPRIASALTIVYPVDAIADLWLLNEEKFKSKYGGINVNPGLGPGDEGWYVRYKHENLTYFFGPITDFEEARKKMWDMQAVRDEAIRNEPALASSDVDFVKFTYSGVYGQRGEGGDGDGSADGSGAGGDGTDGTGNSKTALDGAGSGADGSGAPSSSTRRCAEGS